MTIDIVRLKKYLADIVRSANDLKRIIEQISLEPGSIELKASKYNRLQEIQIKNPLRLERSPADSGTGRAVNISLSVPVTRFSGSKVYIYPDVFRSPRISAAG